jgi:hypothetical protein
MAPMRSIGIRRSGAGQGARRQSVVGHPQTSCLDLRAA